MYNNSTYNLSVIITLYNRRNLCLRALKSALKLRFPEYFNYEIVILDDGSEDSPLEVLGKYIDNEFVKYYFQDNAGAGAAKNKGAEFARGEYIYFLDSDDYLLNENSLSELPLAIEKKVDFIYSKKVLIKKNKIEIVKTTPFSGESLFEYMLQHPLNYAGMPGYIFNRNKFLSCGGFNTDYKWGDAMTFWRVFLEDAKYTALDSINYVYDMSISEGSVSRSRGKQYFLNIHYTIYNTFKNNESKIKKNGYQYNWLVILFITSILSLNYRSIFKISCALLLSPIKAAYAFKYIINKKMSKG